MARRASWSSSTKGAAQQGTFNGNPLSSAAGLATLTQVLTRDAYDHLSKLGSLLAGAATGRSPSPASPRTPSTSERRGASRIGQPSCTNYRDFLETIPDLYWASYPWMVNRGIFMTPGDEEQWTISVQHTEDDIEVYVDAFGEFCQALVA